MSNHRRQHGATETRASLRFDYLQEAQWYFLRAEGNDENLVSVMHRIRASNLQERMDMLGVPVPTPEETYAAALEKWPEHRLHTIMQLKENAKEAR
jgi:hypothetical protein